MHACLFLVPFCAVAIRPVQTIMLSLCCAADNKQKTKKSYVAVFCLLCSPTQKEDPVLIFDQPRVNEFGGVGGEGRHIVRGENGKMYTCSVCIAHSFQRGEGTPPDLYGCEVKKVTFAIRGGQQSRSRVGTFKNKGSG